MITPYQLWVRYVFRRWRQIRMGWHKPRIPQIYSVEVVMKNYKHTIGLAAPETPDVTHREVSVEVNGHSAIVQEYELADLPSVAIPPDGRLVYQFVTMFKEGDLAAVTYRDRDAAGNWSQSSDPLIVEVKDTVAPPKPPMATVVEVTEVYTPDPPAPQPAADG